MTIAPKPLSNAFRLKLVLRFMALLFKLLNSSRLPSRCIPFVAATRMPGPDANLLAGRARLLLSGEAQ